MGQLAKQVNQVAKSQGIDLTGAGGNVAGTGLANINMAGISDQALATTLSDGTILVCIQAYVGAGVHSSN
jgi:hypothetical protein